MLEVVSDYSGTPLSVKLGIAEQSTLVVLHAPPHFHVALPPGVAVHVRMRRHADVVIAFFTQLVKLDVQIEKLEAMILPLGALWIAWPKRSSGVRTDIRDDALRELALPRGLVDNKVCAIDETWTGLRFVWRRDVRTTIHPRP